MINCGCKECYCNTDYLHMKKNHVLYVPGYACSMHACRKMNVKTEQQYCCMHHYSAFAL